MRIIARKHLTNKQRSKLSEKRAARMLNGRVQPASGAMPHFKCKADVKSDRFLLDDKTTIHQSYSLNVKTWNKLNREAWMNDRRPMMRIELANGPVLYVIDELTLNELLEKGTE